MVDADYLLTVVTCSALACSRPEVPRCVPGTTAACACTGSATGVQSCKQDGTFDGCNCTVAAPPTAGGSAAGTPPEERATERPAKRINPEVKLGGMLGMVSVEVFNKDAFTWHNCTVCVNGDWCAKRISEQVPYRPSPGKTVGSWIILNWFIPNPLGPHHSEFMDARGVHNYRNSRVETVSVVCDEGDANFVN